MILVVLVAGCSTTRFYTYGKDFDETKRTQIVKGKSTKDEVVKILGEPNDKELDSNNNETWTYFLKEEDRKISTWDYSSTGNVRLKKLIISFGKDDVVINYVYSDTTNPTTHK